MGQTIVRLICYLLLYRCLSLFMLSKVISSSSSQTGVPKPGGGGYIPPIICLPPNSLRMVHICIPPNILNGFTSERKFGEKSALFLMKTFFWSSPEFGKKKCSIFDDDLFFFFGLHLNSRRKSVPFAFFSLVFTKFPHLSKIVVEVHPPNVENRAKLG